LEERVGVRALVVDATSNSLPYDRSLCDALVRRGAHVILACSRLPGREAVQGSFETKEAFYRVAHRLVGSRAVAARRVARGVEHLPDMISLATHVRRHRPDVVHFQWLPFPLIDGRIVPRIRAVAPVVLTLHNTTLARGQFRTALQCVGYERAVRSASAIIVHTNYSREQLLSDGRVDPHAVHVVPHGALDYYRALAGDEDDHSTSDGRAIVLFFGAIAPYKGVDLLIEAFGALPKDVRASCRLVIAGQPRCDVGALRDLSERLGIAECVTWDLRYVPEAELARLVRSASLVVFPYRSIDQSGALMAALAFDKPVVATRVGGFVELLRDGEHGRLVDPGDSEALAAAIAELVTSPAVRARMTARVRSLREGMLSWDSIAGKTLDVYAAVQGAH
jgi:glycosyltransferase involved in cell wall biosynthesis